MDEKKRPWSQLFFAAAWGLLLFLKTILYLALINDNVFSPEAWQAIQLEYIATLCSLSCLILLALLNFFLYRSKIIMLWSEAVIATVMSLTLAVCYTFSSSHSSITNAMMLLLILLVFWNWYGVWKHYHNSQ